MQKVQFFCDCCGAECTIEGGMGQVGGSLVKMNEKLEPKNMLVNGHYCSECFGTILDFIFAMKEKKNAKDTHIA